MADRFHMGSFDQAIRERLKEKLLREKALRDRRFTKKRKRELITPDHDGPELKRPRTMHYSQIVRPVPLAATHTKQMQSGPCTSSQSRCSPTRVNRGRKAMPLQVHTRLTDSEDEGDLSPLPRESDFESSRQMSPSFCSTPLPSGNELSGSDKENIPPRVNKLYHKGMRGKPAPRASQMRHTTGSPDLFNDDIQSLNERFQVSVATKVADEFHRESPGPSGDTNGATTNQKRKADTEINHDKKRPCVSIESDDDEPTAQPGPRYLRTQFAYIDTEASSAVKVRAASDVLAGVGKKGEELRKKGLLPPLPADRRPSTEELKTITNAVLDNVIDAAAANGQRHLEKVPSLDTLRKVVELVKAAYAIPDELVGVLSKQLNGRRNYIVRCIKQDETADSKKVDRRRKSFLVVPDPVHIRTIVSGDPRFDEAYERSNATNKSIDNYGLHHPTNDERATIDTVCKHFKNRINNGSFSHVDVYIMCQEFASLHNYITHNDITDLVSQNRIPLLRNEKLHDLYLSILLGTKLSVGVKQLAIMRLELFSNALPRLFQTSETRLRTIIDKYRETVQYLVPAPILLVLLTIDYFEENKTCITHAETDLSGEKKNAAQLASGSPLTLLANHTEEGDPTSYDIFLSGVNISTHSDELDAVYHFLTTFLVYNVDETTFEGVDNTTLDPARGKSPSGNGIHISLHFLARMILGADNKITKTMQSKRKSYLSLESRFQKEFFFAFQRQYNMAQIKK